MIELLVVIGIIGVLISLLLPALIKARQSASQQVCASNLRQIVIAATMYAVDTRGSLVPAGIIAYPNGINMYWGYQVVNGIHGTTYSFPDGYLGRYLQTQAVLSCPETKDMVLPAQPLSSTYAMAQLVSYPHTGVVTKISQIQKTSNTVCAADAIGFNPVTGSFTYPGELLPPSASGGGIEQFHGRHPNGKGNVAFFDGHVEPLTAVPKPASAYTSGAPSPGTLSMIAAQHIGLLTRPDIDAAAASSNYASYATTTLDYYYWSANDGSK